MGDNVVQLRPRLSEAELDRFQRALEHLDQCIVSMHNVARELEKVTGFEDFAAAHRADGNSYTRLKRLLRKKAGL